MDSESVKKLGTSLTVPSVQELIKKPITKVPERYLQQNQEPHVVSSLISLPEVPVIDLNKLLTEEDGTELEKLDHACKEWGFFQLINHGVNSSLVENFKKLVQDFFNLPAEEKKVFSQKPGDMEGFGQMFVVSDDHKLEWADLFYLITLPSYIRNPQLFPNIPQPFRFFPSSQMWYHDEYTRIMVTHRDFIEATKIENIEKYSSELKKLSVTIFELMAKALNIQPKELLEFVEDGTQAMRMNYYPPCPYPEQVIGLNPHSDAGCLTILLQVNEMEGLQIRKDGMWIPIKPLPNAFVINIGDILEIMTNGIYRSIEHRATINKEKERISIATFHSPKMNTIIGPAPSLIAKSSAMFNNMSCEDFFKGYFSRQLEGKSYIDVMRLQNK